MRRISAPTYGAAAYAVFLGTFLHAIGFVAGVVVPKSVDAGAPVPTSESLPVDILHPSLFAMQHSIGVR
jgi:hypothetical protein